MTGIPSSGKTTTALKLKEFLETTRQCQVHVVSENEILKRESLDRNVVFSDSRLEKQIRSEVKSESIRLLTKDSVVICDASNYIKGEDTIIQYLPYKLEEDYRSRGKVSSAPVSRYLEKSTDMLRLS